MIYGLIVSVIFMLSIAYIVYVLANKEEGNIKLAGQVLAVLITIIALLAVIYGASGRGHYGMGGRMGGGMMGKDMMGGKEAMTCKMMEMMKKDPSIMKNMCKDPEMKSMMQKMSK